MTEKHNKLTQRAAERKRLIETILSTFWKILNSICFTPREFFFASSYPTYVSAFYNQMAVPFRKEVFGKIETVVPSDEQDGRLKILEIGSGPGFNFDYFPKHCRYTAVDKNVHFKKVLLKNLRKHPGIILENFLDECGENMNSIPSNSFDVVVTSHIHCSVYNSQEVLKEINRVLVPGGRYYFFEHVLDEPTTIRYKWQIFLNKIGLWQFIGLGCTFINFEEEISKADFFKYHGKRYVFSNNFWSYYLVYPVSSHYGGNAVKAE